MDLFMGFRVSAEDYEHGRREAHEDLARGYIEIREPGWLSVISTGRTPECIEHERTVRVELEREHGIERVRVMAGYGTMPSEILEARIEGYNEVVEEYLTRQRGAEWKETLRAEAMSRAYRLRPECYGR